MKLDYCPWCSTHLLDSSNEERAPHRYCPDCRRYVRDGKWYALVCGKQDRRHDCTVTCLEESEVSPPSGVYNKEELREMVKKMRTVSSIFYSGAARTGCHTFIEFCGLMNKYIDICDRAAESGLDFTTSSIHGGGITLPVEKHDVAYLAEKFACIFAQTMFRKPEIWKTFKRAVEHELGGG